MRATKRQRTENEVEVATDLADAIEDIQRLIPTFSVESILSRTREVKQMLGEIPQNVKDLYTLISPYSWIVEIHPSGEHGYNLLVELSSDDLDLQATTQLYNRLLAMGFSPYPSATHLEAGHIGVKCSHPDARLFQAQFKLVADININPMRMLASNYNKNEQTLPYISKDEFS